MTHAMLHNAARFTAEGFGDRRLYNIGLVVGLHLLIAAALYTGIKQVNMPERPPHITLIPAPPSIEEPPVVHPVKPPTPTARTNLEQTPVVDLPRNDAVAEIPASEASTFEPAPPAGNNEGSSLAESRTTPLNQSPVVGIVCPNVREVQAEMRYPREARLAGVQGEVLVRFVLASSGRIMNPQVISSTPNVLNRAALSALAKFQCVGLAQDVIVEAPFVFRLTD